MRAVAVNVGANTNEPGFRGPIRPDRAFTFVPIPETAPTRRPVPTYGDIAPHLDVDVPPAVYDRSVHLDPEFPSYPWGEAYTYGDEHGVKARPLSELSAGDRVYFYATLTVTGAADDLPPDWGAFLIAHFVLGVDPITTTDLTDRQRTLVGTNAHLAREQPNARVLLAGDPVTSSLYDRAVPLSTPKAGTEPGPVVTELSTDSGAGPWWRRPLRFETAAAARLREQVEDYQD